MSIWAIANCQTIGRETFFQWCPICPALTFSCSCRWCVHNKGYKYMVHKAKPPIMIIMSSLNYLKMSYLVRGQWYIICVNTIAMLLDIHGHNYNASVWRYKRNQILFVTYIFAYWICVPFGLSTKNRTFLFKIYISGITLAR